MRAAAALISGFMRLRNIPVVTLTTVGARTGIARTTDLIGIPDGPDAWIIAASFGGSAKHPAWYINMAKNPDSIWLRAGNRRVRVEATNLKADEGESAYARLVAIWKGYAGYRQKTDREIPVVRLTAVE